jgi:hypothetical protein
MLLQTGRLPSNAGTESTTIAYPLLVLALTHSPAKAGIVSFARLLPLRYSPCQRVWQRTVGTARD